MRTRVSIFFSLLAFTTEAFAGGPIWVSGYFYGANLGTLGPSQIDFTTLTHVMHFQLEPHSDGTITEEQLCASLCSDTDPYSAELIYRAHQGGAKVLITVGGDGFAHAFENATSTSASTAQFIGNLMAFFTRGRIYEGVSVAYDGIDIDWEPIGRYGNQFQDFVTQLRRALDALQRPVRPLLTAAVLTPDTDPFVISIVSGVQGLLDQINVMTYPYAGTWSVGYISPLLGSPSVSEDMPAYAATIPSAKLGFGIDFDALQFLGFSSPDPNSGTSESDDGIESTYGQMMMTYYYGQPGPQGTSSFGYYHWDPTAVAPYLSIPGSPTYVTFENETSIQAKIAYASTNGYGGVIIWELAAGFRADMPVGQQDPLMQAVKVAAGLGSSTALFFPTPTPTSPPAPTAKPTVTPTATPTPTPTLSPTPTPSPVPTRGLYFPHGKGPQIHGGR